MSETKRGRGSIKLYDENYVRDISEAVYRAQLGARDTASMIDKDKDGGKKLRARAGSYDSLTRTYLTVIKSMGE